MEPEARAGSQGGGNAGAQSIVSRIPDKIGPGYKIPLKLLRLFDRSEAVAIELVGDFRERQSLLSLFINTRDQAIVVGHLIVPQHGSSQLVLTGEPACPVQPRIDMVR